MHRSSISRIGVRLSSVVAASVIATSSIADRDFAQAVGQQVEPEHQRRDRQARVDDTVREGEGPGPHLVNNAAPVRVRRRQPEAEKAERADGVVDVDGEPDGIAANGAGSTRQDLPTPGVTWGAAP